MIFVLKIPLLLFEKLILQKILSEIFCYEFLNMLNSTELSICWIKAIFTFNATLYPIRAVGLNKLTYFSK